MHRTHAAGLLAVALPVAVTVHWALGLALAVGLGLTRSLTGWLAALAGLLMLWPSLWLFSPLYVASLVWVRHTHPPGAITDTLRARLLTWLYLLRTWSWRGRDTRLACEAADIRSGGLAMDGDPARNEYLQVAYEYGALGAAGLVLLIVALAPFLRLGDPLSATVIAGGVVMAGTSPLVALRRWLAGGDGPIFGPPLRASLTLHVDAEGRVHLYGTDAVDPELRIRVARALFNAGNQWMTRYDLSITEVEGR